MIPKLIKLVSPKSVTSNTNHNNGLITSIAK